MESFFLSETLKYLYLLFDEGFFLFLLIIVENIVNKIDSNAIFTTEGHFLPLPFNYTDLDTAKSIHTCINPSLDKLSNTLLPPMGASWLEKCRDFVGSSSKHHENSLFKIKEQSHEPLLTELFDSANVMYAILVLLRFFIVLNTLDLIYNFFLYFTHFLNIT